MKKKKDAAILNEINYLENISQSGMNIQMACNLMYFETYLIINKILILILYCSASDFSEGWRVFPTLEKMAI